MAGDPTERIELLERVDLLEVRAEAVEKRLEVIEAFNRKLNVQFLRLEQALQEVRKSIEAELDALVKEKP